MAGGQQGAETYQAVIDARTEAQRQYEAARANPTNPENPVLRDYFADVELMYIITGQVSVETMHLVDGAWKVSNRWQFTGTESCR